MKTVVKSMSSLDDEKAKQLVQLQARVGAESGNVSLEGYFDDAIQAVLDFTGQTQANKALLIAAKRLAVVYWNQQADEGETQRIEGGISRTFEATGIPSSIRSSLMPYRVATTRTIR
ncbi:phage head-tail connector protein [Lacticaseibacillus saniviri]